ncbi:MAG: tRNA cyclic N6-threonylcarbamoyladenosine(37) synthase TcdA [Gammaproteobacteria bacterium]|nr:tRNA cyclic N6-threonylcarbamoyladenosine(37) synthase TcdA [Gammaproteobacteria bacterium]MBU1553992.1 tRNA cyclic N6-threonylcarbamoyladenosine(37) synthase TcdA [Gammaproteobacteria bacterium]MBU2071839.1 tRNA cyclic N6-threonylcarbamoyladenosine(37) synthase TcdA [Gammaproteobacteria bacterium]MBU2183170.1 tRNA cyclic N6-threonylcarbamoyladenosine(37) synthase TcdA [Gammaproteobacteria bacterium]MBU2205473.1 tRNA cyclic N6-threonylcarbamoyladenosine(37) synthase TcdA [Gammaproteobacteria
MSDYQLRFAGIARLYGVTALEKFHQAHVCVVGIGGVGSWAAEALARSGIGKITLIDLDDVCISNINRQLHATSDTVGQDKVAVMAQRIKAINPDCIVQQIEDFVTTDNLRQLITTEIDYVVDAIDSIKAKVALLAHCKRNKIKLICTGGAGGQTDPTQIQIADLTQTINDPLLAKVRNSLRRDFNYSRNPKRRFGIDCVFSTEQLVYPQPDGSVCQQKTAQLNEDGEVSSMRLDCSGGFGAVTVVTASFGFAAVSRVLKKLAQS